MAYGLSNAHVTDDTT